MDAGSRVILPTIADLFHCESFPVRAGKTPGKGRRWGGGESQSRWMVFHGGKKIRFFLGVELGECRGGQGLLRCAAGTTAGMKG